VDGRLEFHRNYSVTDINSASFFNGTGTIKSIDPDSPKYLGDLHVNFTLPLSAERLAKIFYSLVLADLGQTKSTIFETPDLLLDWVKSISDYGLDVSHRVGEENMLHLGRFNTTMGFWERSFASMPPIGPSTIYTRYACQVPELKSPGTLILAVFLADMVVLRALWWVFSELMLWRLTWSDPSAMTCSGCVYRLAEEGLSVSEGCRTSTASSKNAAPVNYPR